MGGRRRLVIFVAFGWMAGCAAILGREDIVFDEDTLRPDSSDDRTTIRDDASDGGPDDASLADVTTEEAGDAGPTCPDVDASCDLDASADAGCCPGLECRNARCSRCVALDGACVSGGNTRCCGSAVCGPGNTCMPCIEADASCEITEPQLCCTKQCSPVKGCF